jgi:hypothetical protein
VVESFEGRISDVHPGSGPNVLEVVEELEVFCVVIAAIQLQTWLARRWGCVVVWLAHRLS